jgi:PrcB C-terminal
MTMRRCSVLGLCAALGACGSSPEPAGEGQTPVAVEVVYRGSRCPASEPGARAIDDEAGWAEWQAAQQRTFLPAADDVDANVDFGDERIIVVSMGTKPTAGYSIDVAAGAARLRGDTLEIDADWLEPAEGAVVAQVLTSPCIALAVPAADFDRVRVVDRDGDTVVDAGL